MLFSRFFLGKRDAFYWVVLLLGFLPAGQVSAEACPAYQEFLDGKNVTTIDDNCKDLEAFLIQNANISAENYYNEFLDRYSADTPLGLLAAALRSKMNGLDIVAYDLFELAGRAIFYTSYIHDLHERGDFYSDVISKAVSDISVAYCVGEPFCGNLRDRFFRLQDVRNDHPPEVLEKPLETLHCLLKVDAFTAPVGVVLQSNRFKNCSEP